ncbi:hypothetical protein H4R35_004487, partial [Dimargaris xerosporica]
MLNKHSFDNPLLTNAQLVQSTSQRCGLSAKLEQQLLQHGCKLIQSAGIVLSLPQVAMASAQVLLWRFFHVCSLTEFSLRDVAMGCLFLASKVEESPRKIKDVINVFDYVIKKQRQQQHQEGPIMPLEPFSQMFYDLKNGVTIAELQILRHLSFNVQVQLPYGLLVNYLQCLRLTTHPRVPQMAWNYLNDSTVLFLMSIAGANLGALAANPGDHGQEYHNAPSTDLSLISAACSSAPIFEKKLDYNLSKHDPSDSLIKIMKRQGIPDPQRNLDNMFQGMIPSSSATGKPGAKKFVEAIKNKIPQATLDDLILYFAPVFAHYMVNAAYSPSSNAGQLPRGRLCEDAKEPISMCYVDPLKWGDDDLKELNPIARLLSREHRLDYSELIWIRFLQVTEKQSLVLTEEQKKMVFHVGWEKGLTDDEVRTKTSQGNISFQTLRSEAVRYLGQLALTYINIANKESNPAMDALFRIIA